MGVWILFRNYKLHAEIFPAETWFMPLTVCPDELYFYSPLCVSSFIFLKLKIIFSLF